MGEVFDIVFLIHYINCSSLHKKQETSNQSLKQIMATSNGLFQI